MDEDTLVQYLLVRKDLKWPTGALIAQACHASTAAIHESAGEADTVAYLRDLANMHKIVLEAGSAEALHETSTALAAAGVAHKLWIEQPEAIPTCLASRPAPRKLLQPFFRAFKLLR
jgi:peptidyl-tRNA hydrolase